MKIILITLIVILSVSSLYSINEKGVKLGVNLSTLSFQDRVDAEFSPHGTIGLFCNYKVSNKIAIQPEVRFVLKKIKYDGRVEQYYDNDGDGLINEDPFDLLDNDGDMLVDEDRPDNFSYGTGYLNSRSIEFPILFSYQLGDETKSKWRFLAGPSFNIIADNEITFNGLGFYKMKFNKDKFDLGGMFGIEYRAKNDLIIELSFSQSILENDWKLVVENNNDNLFGDNNIEDLFGTLDSRYSSFSLTIGLEM